MDNRDWYRLTKGYVINEDSGKAEDCSAGSCTLHFLHAAAGDMLDSSAPVQVAIYDGSFDEKYIYTYDYEPEETWTTFEGFVTTPHCFEKDCFFRISGDILPEWKHGDLHCGQIFAEEIKKVTAKVSEVRSGDSLNFILLADTHYTVNGTWDDTAANVNALAGKITGLDGIIHLGDLTDGMVQKERNADYVNAMQRDMRSTGCHYYQVTGNHDSNYFHGNPERFSRSEMEALYFAAEPDNVTRPAGALYYYADFADKHIRCIFLDSFDPAMEPGYGFDDDQLDWIDDALHRVPENFRTVIFSHVPPTGRLHYWSSEIRGSVRLMRILKKYQAETGGLLGLIHGHNHADQVDMQEGFPIISVDCCKCEDFKDKKPDGAAVPDRVYGRISEESWNIVSISAKRGTIDLTRFGAGSDIHTYAGEMGNTGRSGANMKKVITYGTFDLFHEGHYSLLKRAKELGDYLIVGITTEHFDEQRGKINVVDSLMDRIENVKKTGLADQIIIEDHDGQKIEDIQKYGVDVFVEGSDWIGTFDYLKNFCKVVYLERTPNISSTMLRSQKYPIIRLGVIGTGRIAPRFISEAKFVSGMIIRGVYNPHEDSARKFAKNYEVDGFSGDFNAFLNEVDAIYIATPHETHFDYAMKALNAGKHVLCEKPLALSRSAAEQLYSVASKKKLVLMEGIKTAYCPGFAQIINVAKSGKIGEIRDVEACFSRLTRPDVRETVDSNYGGAFLEFGSYTVLPIIKLLGLDYQNVEINSILSDNGVDLYTKIQFRYRNGLAMSKTGIGVKSEGQLLISGTSGYILAQSPWWLTRKFEIRYEDPNKVEQFTPTFIGDGLRYEISEFISKINGQGLHAYKLTAEESIAMADVVERFMKQREEEKAQRRAENLESGMKIWAHRGCSYKHPENTLPAFEAACRLSGITGIELDIQLSKDGEIMVFHDETLNRLMNKAGYLRDYSAKQLSAMKFKSWDYESGTADTDRMYIPTMEEVLKLVKPYSEKSGIMIDIELKNSVIPYEGLEEKILGLVKKYGMEKHVLYSSFSGESLLKLKKLSKEISVGILDADIQKCREFITAHRIEAIHPCVDTVDSGKNIPDGTAVRAWNGREPFYKQSRYYVTFRLQALRDKGITDFITNVPEDYLE